MNAQLAPAPAAGLSTYAPGIYPTTESERYAAEQYPPDAQDNQEDLG